MAAVRVWRVAWPFGLLLVAVTTLKCSHDYDRFDLTGAGGSSGSSAAGGSSTGGSSGTRGGASGTGASPADGSAGRPADGSSCGAGEKLCGASCVLTSDPGQGCAAPSCNPCSSTNGTASCSAGACAITCTSGFGDCNSSPTDGCEQATTGNAMHCGECGRACSGMNVGGRECSGNTCTSSCKPGFGNCNRPSTGADDGCEEDTSASLANCGGCGNDCSQQGAVGNGLTCSAGRCGCSADAQCQTNTSGGTATCNATTRNCVCGGQECKAGEACRRRGNDQECSCNGGGPCATNSVCCRTASPGCKSLLTDAANCGACGRACVTGFICTNGECACNAAADCNGGSPGRCNAGLCSCGGASDAGADAATGTTCAPGERCLGDSSCG